MNNEENAALILGVEGQKPGSGAFDTQVANDNQFTVVKQNRSTQTIGKLDDILLAEGSGHRVAHRLVAVGRLERFSEGQDPVAGRSFSPGW